MDQCASCFSRRVIFLLAALVLGCHLYYVKVLSPKGGNALMDGIGGQDIRTSATKSIGFITSVVDSRPVSEKSAVGSEVRSSSSRQKQKTYNFGTSFLGWCIDASGNEAGRERNEEVRDERRCWALCGADATTTGCAFHTPTHECIKYSGIVVKGNGHLHHTCQIKELETKMFKADVSNQKALDEQAQAKWMAMSEQPKHIPAPAPSPPPLPSAESAPLFSEPPSEKDSGGPEPTQWGVRFSYKPYIAPLPIMVDDKARAEWESNDKANGGRVWMEVHRKCAKFAPEGQEVREGKELVICDPNNPSGNHTDVLIFRRNLRLPPMGCSKLRKQPFKEVAPDPKLFKDAGSDIIGYDSWSFQHFLEGPVMRLVQNLEYYKKYNAQVLAQLRTNTGSYNNPVVPLIYEKAGLRDQLSGWCGGYNTLNPCVPNFIPDVSIACSWPKLLPELAAKWRMLMGVSETLPPGGRVVLFMRGAGGSSQSHKGRVFTNPKAMRDALQDVATEYGLQYEETSTFPTETIESITQYFSDVRLLIGAHGGAMWNFYFMPRGAGVIEISGNGAPTFWKHMAGYGSFYGPLKVPMVGGHDPLHSDLEPEPERLAKLVKKVLERTGAAPVK